MHGEGYFLAAGLLPGQSLEPGTPLPLRGESASFCLLVPRMLADRTSRCTERVDLEGSVPVALGRGEAQLRGRFLDSSSRFLHVGGRELVLLCRHGDEAGRA